MGSDIQAEIYAKTGYNGPTQIQKVQRGKVRAKTEFLRTSGWNLSKSESRLVFYVLIMSKLEGNDFGKLTMRVSDFASVIQVNSHNLYGQVKSVVENLQKRTLTYELHETEKGHVIETINWVNRIRYLIDQGKVEVELSPHLEQFFSGQPYTEWEYAYLMQFNSGYSSRLYTLLKAFAFKKTVDFTLVDFRQRLGMPEGMYTNYADFKRRVLKLALQDINEYTELQVELEEIRGAKNKVVHLIFHLTKRNVKPMFERLIKSSAGKKVKFSSEQLRKVLLEVNETMDTDMDDEKEPQQIGFAEIQTENT